MGPQHSHQCEELPVSDVHPRNNKQYAARPWFDLVFRHDHTFLFCFEEYISVGAVPDADNVAMLEGSDRCESTGRPESDYIFAIKFTRQMMDR
jgi:hypothetical protein